MHIPVLLNETIEYLQPQTNQNFIDCTIGGGGHALKILSLIEPKGKLLGIDLTPEAIENLKISQSANWQIKAENRLVLINGNFANIKEIVEGEKFYPVNGILFDLGLSSDILESGGKGFSFMREEELDMRYNPGFAGLTAKEIVNKYPEEKLAEIFKENGGERFSRRIASKIVSFRKKRDIETTFQLKNLIKEALGRYFHIKSLARVFQSLRIEVNGELRNLGQGLISAVEILAPGGRLAVISYHSLEDRLVKKFFKEKKRNSELNILTKKPIRPEKKEIKENSRSRSAKLRVAEKI